MEQTVEAGTVASVVVNVIDDAGAHAAATIDTANTRLQKGDSSDTTWNNAAPTVDTIAAGVYRINFSGLSPAIAISDNDDLVRVRINGNITGDSAWTEYHLPVRVVMSSESAQNLESSASTIVRGAAVAGTLSTTEMTTDLTEVTADHYKSRVIIWTSGALKDQAASISAYDGSSKKITYSTVTDAPTAADTFVIV